MQIFEWKFCIKYNYFMSYTCVKQPIGYLSQQKFWR